ncbi:MAG TPA: hypothetical protein VEK57_26985 [Thermoanaerobaculia bacterium]|nr:hypothetical protein [Thermoanaerobaculia bacterium]
MNIRSLTAIVILTAGIAASAQQKPAMVRKTIRTDQKFTVAAGGSFVLENPIGNIEILGADVVDVEASIVTTITAETEAILKEAQRQSGIAIGGNVKTRIVRTAVALDGQKKPWTMRSHWTVRVPRSISVRIISSSSERIRIVDLAGSIHVKNFNGNVIVSNVAGAAFVESVNGSIVYSTAVPHKNVVLSTVNGHVTATVAGTADFRWVAETGTGDIRTNFAPRGRFGGATFRGTVNAPGGPTITTQSLMGNVYLLTSGTSATASQSIRTARPAVMSAAFEPTVGQPEPGPNGQRVFTRGVFRGSLVYQTSVGDVRVNEIHGRADIRTGAGEVRLGSVTGSCNVTSKGGPLQLGEILGPLTASTGAGDILVDSTRRGGTITTKGGTIRLLYTSGPTRLESGGGDIIVRQAAAPIVAETTSGDIAITVDGASKSETIDAKTGKGNVVLQVGPKFAADIDATIITTDPNADTILSDIPGLSITRQQVSGKTRVRAVGKINGGGEKVVLLATNGDIRITTGAVAPTIVRPR